MIISSLLSVLEVLLVTVPALLVVAFVTVAERKTMASMQRRLGPNLIGYYGLLQAFADALKLLLKEYVSPTQSNFILFFLGPVITLVFSLLSFAVIPYASGLTILDLDLGILYLLAVSSLATYGILLAGWSANSKYAFLGSLRSTAQLISYELIISSAILIVILFTGSLNLTFIVESQKAVWLIFPLFPIFIIFFISCIAETNRAPFDLAEAESELVSGFMTEHSAVVFVFFFLAEYASIVLMCILTSILFLGGGLPIPLFNIIHTISLLFTGFITVFFFIFPILFIVLNIFNRLFNFVNKIIGILTILWVLILVLILVQISILYASDELKTLFTEFIQKFMSINSLQDLKNIISLCIWLDQSLIFNIIQVSDFEFSNFYLPSSILSSLYLGIKTCINVFIFIWVRASFPRIRFDQLMSFCWTVLLPIVVAFIIIVPCILYGFDILPNNISIL